MTSILGSEFKTSLDLIEIDITFSCNLKCYNCDRSCSQAPSDDYISVDQIQKFINESLTSDRSWKRIRILGGEPFLHPDIIIILDMLNTFVKDHSPATRLEIVTNGYGSVVKDAIKKVPSNIFIKNTGKTGKFQQKFEAFNLAPIDKRIFFITDYSNKCWVTSYCGIGLNPFGYYLCGVGGSIDRVTGMDIGLKELPKENETFISQSKSFCCLCGHFFSRDFIPINTRIPVKGEPKSKSWKAIYDRYRNFPPQLTRY